MTLNSWVSVRVSGEDARKWWHTSIKGLQRSYIRTEQCRNCVTPFCTRSSIYIMLFICRPHQRTNSDTRLCPHGAADVLRFRFLEIANPSHDMSGFKGNHVNLCFLITICLFKSKIVHTSKFLYDWSLKIINILYVYNSSLSCPLESLPNFLSHIWFLFFLIAHCSCHQVLYIAALDYI